MSDEILTIAEVADVLKCTEDHARALCAAGRLPFIDIGTRGRRVYRVRQSTLDSFLRNERKALIREQVAEINARLRAPSLPKRW